MRKRKILVISPHTDDELFGCGGTLLKLKEEGHDIMIAVMSCSERYLSHLKRVVTESEQWDEFVCCSRQISTTDPRKFESTTRLEEVSDYKIVRWLDELILEYRPDTVFIPEPSYHQEHQQVYRTAIAACRPTFGDRSIESIFLYEIPTSTWSGAHQTFKPNVYVDITNYVDKKMQIFKDVYKIQYTEEKRNLLGEKGIKSHAKYRGIESSQEFSESFMLIKTTALL